MKLFGTDMGKWYITRTQSTIGKWHVCPPLNDDFMPTGRGGQFNTGAEALAAFASGGRP